MTIKYLMIGLKFVLEKLMAFEWLQGSGRQKSYCSTCQTVTESVRAKNIIRCLSCGCVKGIIDSSP